MATAWTCKISLFKMNNAAITRPALKEGVMRQAQFVNGKYDDLIAYALLREEWTA